MIISYVKGKHEIKFQMLKEIYFYYCNNNNNNNKNVTATSDI